MDIIFDKEKCTHCGLCISDCVSKCLNFGENNIPERNEKHCISCGHCYAICPSGAVRINKEAEISEIPHEGVQGGLFETEKKNIGDIKPEDILTLIKNRRSIRQYKDEEISAEIFCKLKKMLPYIPTGCNSHALHFTIVEKKEAMDVLRKTVNEKINKALSNHFLSAAANKFERYKKAFLEGEDVVFRGAPHLVVVSSPITAPCANVDPIIALSYFELYAQSLGLGTCWCGYAEMCIKLFPELCNMLEIPQNYIPVYAMLLGIPKVKYSRETQPEPYKISEIKEIHQTNSCFFCNAKRVFTNFLR